MSNKIKCFVATLWTFNLGMRVHSNIWNPKSDDFIYMAVYVSLAALFVIQIKDPESGKK